MANLEQGAIVSDQPSAANVVVIGAGIVGNSVVGHLAELGWRDIVQIDKECVHDGNAPELFFLTC